MKRNLSKVILALSLLVVATPVAFAQDAATIELEALKACRKTTTKRPANARSCRFEVTIADTDGNAVPNQAFVVQSREFNCANKPPKRGSWKSFVLPRQTDEEGEATVGVPLLNCTQYRIVIGEPFDRSFEVISNTVTVYKKADGTTTTTTTSTTTSTR